MCVFVNPCLPAFTWLHTHSTLQMDIRVAGSNQISLRVGVELHTVYTVNMAF